MHKFLVIILLATLTLTLMVPAVSGISLFQEAKAKARNGENGDLGTNTCSFDATCITIGGPGGIILVGHQTAMEEMEV
jgi:hypothetical protein